MVAGACAGTGVLPPEDWRLEGGLGIQPNVFLVSIAGSPDYSTGREIGLDTLRSCRAFRL